MPKDIPDLDPKRPDIRAGKEYTSQLLHVQGLRTGYGIDPNEGPIVSIDFKVEDGTEFSFALTLEAALALSGELAPRVLQAITLATQNESGQPGNPE